MKQLAYATCKGFLGQPGSQANDPCYLQRLCVHPKAMQGRGPRNPATNEGVLWGLLVLGPRRAPKTIVLGPFGGQPGSQARSILLPAKGLTHTQTHQLHPFVSLHQGWHSVPGTELLQHQVSTCGCAIETASAPSKFSQASTEVLIPVGPGCTGAKITTHFTKFLE